MASRKRSSSSVARDGKTAIMAAALICTGVFEMLEGIEEGEDPIDSALDAVRKTRLRGKAIQKASRDVARAERKRKLREGR